MIELNNLTFKYREDEAYALDHISISFKKETGLPSSVIMVQVSLPW